MKKLIVLSVAFMAFLFSSISASAENSTGNVSLWAYSDRSQMTVSTEFSWWGNDSGNYIQTFLYWDTIPNSFRFVDSSSWGVKHYDKDGSLLFTMNPYVPCKRYEFKLIGIDGKSGKQFTLYRNEETPGATKPSITSFSFTNFGFNFVEISASIINFCNWADFEIKVAEFGKKPLTVINGGVWERLNTTIDNLEPNKQYMLSFRLSNFLGDTTITYSFMTRSNLPPVVESNWCNKIKNTSLVLQATIDPRNTWSTYGYSRIGETLDNMNIQTERQYISSKGVYSFSIEDCKPNTVYFAEVVAENDFGDHSAHPIMFKTNEFATSVTEITSNDLLQVSSCPSGIRIFAEKDAIVEIYSITGTKILTANITGGEAQIFSSLTPGIYIVKSSIEGFTVSKKAMVN